MLRGTIQQNIRTSGGEENQRFETITQQYA
jgi:hypothetical protein